MNALSASLRHTRPIWLVLMVVLALGLLAPFQTAQAKGPSKNRLIIGRDGTVFAPKKSDRTFSAAYAGSAVTEGSNAQTGELKNLKPVRPQSPESVIGPDQRTQVTDTAVYPNRAIAHLEITFPIAGQGSCTGFFIDPTRLATAGHCVYSFETAEWASSIIVYPGRSGATEPYGHYTATQIFTVTGWVNTANPKFDYGLVVLGTNVGNTVGWFGYGWNSDNTFYQDRKSTVRGFPGDKPYGTMWTMGGKIQQVAKTRFFYSIDTFGGQSGSPHYGKWGTCNPCAFGVHTYGTGPGVTKNSSTRITKSAFNFFQNTGVAP